MSSSNNSQWPFISSDTRPLFLTSEPIEFKPRTYTDSWQHTNHPPQKRCRVDEADDCKDETLKPTHEKHAESQTQHTPPRKVRVTPTLIAHQNSRHFRISHIGDYLIDWAYERLHPMGQRLQQQSQSLRETSDYQMNGACGWGKEESQIMEERTGRNEDHIMHTIEQDGNPNDKEFELDTELLPGLPGIVSRGSRVPHNSRGRCINLVDNLPTLSTREDGSASVSFGDRSVVVHNVDTSEVVCNNNNDDDSSCLSSNSSYLSSDEEVSDDSSLLSLDTEDDDSTKALVPEAPIGDLLSAYLRPGRTPEIPNSAKQRVARPMSSQPAPTTFAKQVHFLDVTPIVSLKPLRSLLSFVHTPLPSSPTTTSPPHKPTKTSRLWEKYIEKAKKMPPPLPKQSGPTLETFLIPKPQSYLKPTCTSMLVEKSILKGTLESQDN